MNPPSPDDTPNTGGEIARRLDALRTASDPSATAASPAKPDDLMPNLPAQKLLVILAGMHAILVSLGKTSAKNHATAQAEMEGIKERMATKDLLAALFGSHRDDIATLAETLGALQDQQQELMQRVTVAAVTLGVMLLGLAVLLGALLGGHR